MSEPPKMIIITSDEDLIQQVLLKRTINTHIIDLNDQNQMTSIDNNDVSFLTQLSELNSRKDQIYKRALDSPHDEQAKLSKKSASLMCAVCGDRAIGFNYDVLSCGSCKAFFLRNANQQSRRIRCLTGQNQCSVAHDIQRKCPRCRLDRCLAVGMKKDFLLSDEAKQRRKKPVKDKKNESSKRSSTSLLTTNSEALTEPFDEIDRLLMGIDKDDDSIPLLGHVDFSELEDISLRTLSVEDWITIENVRSSFLAMFENGSNYYSFSNLSNRANALISWSQHIDNMALKLITFFRQIDEFENLNNDDRFLLIKYNLHPNFSLFKSFLYQSHDDDHLSGNNHRQFFKLCGDSWSLHNARIQMVFSLVQVSEQDPIILSLLSTIFIFTVNFAINDERPLFNDSSAVHRAQGHYTTLLWKYLVSKEGEIQACRHFARLLTTILQVQSTSYKIQQFFRAGTMSCDAVDKVAPLMQTVLQIS